MSLNGEPCALQAIAAYLGKNEAGRKPFEVSYLLVMIPFPKGMCGAVAVKDWRLDHKRFASNNVVQMMGPGERGFSIEI